MPDIGRWGVIDPLAEVTPHLSAYHYANNNPLMYNDPTGMLSQSFVNQLSSSPHGTTWYNTGSGFVNNWGRGMDYDGNSINWSMGYANGLLGDVGAGPAVDYMAYIGGGGGGGYSIQNNILSWWTNGAVGYRTSGETVIQELVSHKLKLNNGDGFDWYGYGGKGNWFFGTGATFSGIAGIIQSENMYAQGIRRGLEGNYKLRGRNLSQFGSMKMTNATKPISKIGNFGARLSRGSFGAGIIMDAIGVHNYLSNPNSLNVVHPEKAGLNTIMGYVGLKGGPYGAIISTLYFGIDSFYPGGWVGASETAARIEAHEQQVTGHPFF